MKETHRHPSAIGFQRITAVEGAEPSVRLLPDEIHVWGLSLDIDESQVHRLDAWLSADERQRASRLVSESLRQQFTAAHGALRLVLGRYCGMRPDELIVQRTARGKPFLSEPALGGEPLQFNMTHSHGRALIVVARGREIGVDLERVRQPKADSMRLAHRFFSPQDQLFISSAEPSIRHERFLQVWVANEAVSKAEGSGITFPLNRRHMEMDRAAEEGRLMGSDKVLNEKQIVFRFLPMESDWVGAVAAEGSGWRWRLCT